MHQAVVIQVPWAQETVGKMIFFLIYKALVYVLRYRDYILVSPAKRLRPGNFNLLFYFH